MERNISGLKRGGSPGRPKGAPNKATVEIREASRRLLEDPAYQRSLLERLVTGKAPHMETLLHYYAYGKPKDAVDLQVTDVSTLTDEELQTRVNALAALVNGRDAA